MALVVGKNNKVERRQIETEREIGDAWLVTSGINPGDQVIVEGLQKVRPGADVKAVPAASVQKAASAPPTGSGGSGSGSSR